jgi:hypothetical protein
MRTAVILAIASLVACTPAAPPRRDVQAGMVPFDIALVRALEAHDHGDPEAARAAWRDAHAAWDTTIAPGLSPLDPREVASCC